MEQEIKQKVHSEIHLGHFAMVIGVAVALLGVTWLKNPEGFLPKKQESAFRADLPKYYAYEEPFIPDGPRVAGASTLNGDLPSILNEDGTVSQTISMGDVLGVTTNDLESMSAQIRIIEIPDSDKAIINYLNWTQGYEFTAVDNATLENALSSSDQTQLDIQANKFEGIKASLLSHSVPMSLSKLHKLKILQYQSGINLFRVFTKADENPELVTSNLGTFIQTQQEMESEANKVDQKYSKLLNPEVLAADQVIQNGGAQ